MKNSIFIAVFFGLISMSCSKMNDPEPTVIIENDIKKKVLLEKVSSTNCGSCPLAQYEVGLLHDSLGDDLIYMSHYLFGPLNHAHTDYLLEKINKTYFTPLAFIDRADNGEGTVFFQTFAWEDEIKAGLMTAATIGIEIKSIVSDNKAQISIVLKNEGLESETNRLHVFLIEKIVVGEGKDYDQKNYGNEDPDHPYYGRGEFIEGFEHKNIIRERISAADGNKITWVEGEAKADFALSFIPASGKFASDYSLVAFVADGEVPISGTIINAQRVNLGESITMFD
ncbi:MAG: Omp28-related outer membrane protein [Salibacteraceae bacterium]|nr:Omp28-related outer membrane protein [Salibacteraceae bacterium]